MKKIVIAALAAAMPLAPASAATCWTPAAVEAAQVRDFEMMLMVSALRCRSTANNFLPAYNRFVQEKRAALTEVNEELRSHFQSIVGKGAALGAYDNYVTGIANSYGSGAQGLGCRDMESLTAAANALPPTRSGLLQLARAADTKPRLAGAACEAGVTIAANTATAPMSSMPMTAVAVVGGGVASPAANLRMVSGQ
ncbi:MAG: hypothetical protein ABW039_13200 [Sphingobium sp.]